MPHCRDCESLRADESYKIVKFTIVQSHVRELDPLNVHREDIQWCRDALSSASRDLREAREKFTAHLNFHGDALHVLDEQAR